MEILKNNFQVGNISRDKIYLWGDYKNNWYRYYKNNFQAENTKRDKVGFDYKNN